MRTPFTQLPRLPLQLQGEDTAIESSCLERGRTLEVGAPAPRTQALESGALPGRKEGSGNLSASLWNSQQASNLAKGSRLIHSTSQAVLQAGPTPASFRFRFSSPTLVKSFQPTTDFPIRTVVQIAFVRTSDGMPLNCSGTMISRNVVLTAGHCVHEGSGEGMARKFPDLPGSKRPTGAVRSAGAFCAGRMD